MYVGKRTLAACKWELNPDSLEIVSIEKINGKIFKHSLVEFIIGDLEKMELKSFIDKYPELLHKLQMFISKTKTKNNFVSIKDNFLYKFL